MTSPIDIVYTWVDNNDSFWQEKKARAKESSFDEKYANVNGRFRDNGELKYSLRSVAKYFPDVNKIYIVTDNQVPNFLRKHEKIVIVDHTDIILKEFLPTFSSKNIESHLVNISGLSENFIYFNDDVFLGPDFQVTDFFAPEPVCYFTLEDQDYTPGFSNILRAKFGEYEGAHLLPNHSPKAMTLSSFRNFEIIFSEYTKSVQKEVFRDTRNPSILCDLYPQWLTLSRKGRIGTKKAFYMQTGDIDAIKKYAYLEAIFSSLTFFCINDTGDNLPSDDVSLRKVSEVLDKLLGEPIEWERG